MSLFELQAWLGHCSPQLHPALRADHPGHADQGLHRRRVLRAERPRDRGAPRPRRDHQRPSRPTAGRSSSTTSGTATAPTASSSSARTGWRAPAATSTSPSRRARRSCSKPRTGCSGCSSQIPLTDDERAAVEGDHDAIDRLLDRLVDTPPRRPDPARARRGRTWMPAPRLDVVHRPEALLPLLTARPRTEAATRLGPVASREPVVAVAHCRRPRPDGFKVASSPFPSLSLGSARPPPA